MVEQVEKTKKEIEKEQTEKIMARHKDSFNIPKIELHTHIGGCIRPTTFMELVESKNIDIELMDFYKVDIAMAFEFFKITAQMITDLVILRRVVREMIEDYANHSTKYLEIRSTPKTFAKAGGGNDSPVSKTDYINAILHEIQNCEDRFKSIKVRYIISINRTQGVEAARENLALAVEARKNSNLVVGLELSGDPRLGNFADLKPVFEEARSEHGLKITLHCAETEDQAGEEAQDMIEFKPDRLGHCCYLSDE